MTQVLGTCVYLYCTLAMCKQHKNQIALLTRELGKRKKIRATRFFSDHPLGRDTSPTYVCALVMYIGNAQTTQKQHFPIAQGAWQKEKMKNHAMQFSPTTHWVVTQVLRTCVHLHCTLAMRKQHKNNNALLARNLGRKKKQKSARRGFLRPPTGS